MGVYRKIGEGYDPNSFCILKYYEPAPPKVQIILSYDQYFFLPTTLKFEFCAISPFFNNLVFFECQNPEIHVFVNFLACRSQ